MDGAIAERCFANRNSTRRSLYQKASVIVVLSSFVSWPLEHEDTFLLRIGDSVNSLQMLGSVNYERVANNPSWEESEKKKVDIQLASAIFKVESGKVETFFSFSYFWK